MAQAAPTEEAPTEEAPTEEAPTEEAPQTVSQAETIPHSIEVTFGNAQLFFGTSVLTEEEDVQDKLVPVGTALMMAEWLATSHFSVIGAFFLPLETQTTIIDGELREEFVAPAAALGGRFSLFSLSVFRNTVVELQLAGLLARTLGSVAGDRFFPIVATRIHFRTDEGFTLYLGNSYSFAENTGSVIYGIGHRF